MNSAARIFSMVMIAVVFCAQPEQACAQDMRKNTNRSLFADQKATRVGETVTVLIVEAAQASNDASTNTSRSSDLALNGSVQTPGATSSGATVGLQTGNAFKGEGATSNRGVMKAKISAHVDSVFSNGNLYISGSRNIVINGDEQIMKVAGIVRPSDIQADNSIYSYSISDAVISYSGNGIINDSQKPGWITKFFHWIF
ncbi:MAG TPA: flagellar basal body L-ring protein FlgH [Bacteroidota bacterium]|nr:flagellar basal body L-ring protein FlgH [Bacteroidota bacterium]